MQKSIKGLKIFTAKTVKNGHRNRNNENISSSKSDQEGDGKRFSGGTLSEDLKDTKSNKMIFYLYYYGCNVLVTFIKYSITPIS